MIEALRSVASLLLGAGILILANGLMGITLPIRMGIEGLPPEVSGLVMSSYYAGLVGGCIFGQRIIGRVGHIRAFAAFAAVASAATLLHALWFDVLPWAILRGVSGFCLAGLFASIESWLNVRSSNETRGQILSFYMVTAYFSSGVGQLLVNGWQVTGVELFCLAALMFSLSLVPVVLTRVDAPDLGHIRALSFRQLYEISPLGVAGTFGAGLLSGAFYGMGAIFGQAIGLSIFSVSLFMGASVFGGLLLQWPIGRLSDRFDRRTVLVWVLTATAVVCFAQYLVAVMDVGTFGMMFALTGLFGGFMATLYPISVAHAFDYVDRDQTVAASAGMLLAWAIGATCGPLLAAAVMGQLGPSSLFLFLMVTGAALAAFARHRMRQRPALPAEEQGPFVPLDAIAVGSQLDPRTDTGDDLPPAEEEPRRATAG
ncbi:MFS transporter [Rhodospirillaceae bacterium SYSU D60014]|uniref:MFS transporter n=1 Tax=Virgifigura deserti TaxID=2268457 RepID=UPI000E66A7D7